MSIRPGAYNLTATRGDDLRRTLTWKAGSPPAPVDLTGCTAKLQARDVLGNLKVDISTTANANGSITLGGAAGTIAVYISHAATALAADDYLYDLQITLANGDVRTLVNGTVTILPEQTT